MFEDKPVNESEGAAIAPDEFDSIIDDSVNESTIEGETVSPSFTTAQQLEPVLGMAFKVLAPNWKVQAEEVQVLAESYGECLDYYYPDMGEALPPWLTPLVVTAAIVGPRMNTPRKIEEKDVKGERVNDAKS